MKKKLIISILGVLTLISCENIETDSKKGELDKILSPVSNNLNYFDKDCVKAFEEALSMVGMIRKGDTLVDICSFVPSSIQVVNKHIIESDTLFIALAMKHDTKKMYQMYFYDSKFHNFIPTQIEKNNRLIIDPKLALSLYFDKPLVCSGDTIRGSTFKEPEQNGMFKRYNAPGMNGYVDSILRVRNSQKN